MALSSSSRGSSIVESVSIMLRALPFCLLRARDMLAMLQPWVAEDGADGADDAGAVVVADDEEVAGDGGIDEEAVDLDDARGLADDGAGDAEARVALAEFGDEEFVSIRSWRGWSTREVEAHAWATAGALTMLTWPSRRAASRQRGEGGAGDQGGVLLAERAVVGDADRVRWYPGRAWRGACRASAARSR